MIHFFNVMQEFQKVGLALFVILGAVEIGMACDFDGSRLITCIAEKGIEYRGRDAPKNFVPESVGLPDKFFVNFKDKLIVPTIDSLVRRTTPIQQSRHIEDKLILQGTDEGVEGVEDGIGWSMAISKETGKFVISVSGTAVGYVVFGSCTCIE